MAFLQRGMKSCWRVQSRVKESTAASTVSPDASGEPQSEACKFSHGALLIKTPLLNSTTKCSWVCQGKGQSTRPDLPCPILPSEPLPKASHSFTRTLADFQENSSYQCSSNNKNKPHCAYLHQISSNDKRVKNSCRNREMLV